MKPVAVSMMMIAGVALYIGVYHLVVALRAPDRDVDRAFGVHCLLVVTYAMAEAMLVNAPTIEAAYLPGYYLDTVGLGVAATFAIFVQRYTRLGDRRIVHGLAAILFVGILVVCLGPSTWVIDGGYAYRDVDAIVAHFGFYESTPGVGARVIQVLAVANGVAALALAIRFAASGDRRGYTLLGAVAIALVAAAHDLLAESERVVGVYWLCYGFVAQAVVMAFALSDDVLRAAVAEARLRESEERLELAIEGASDGIFDWDLRNGSAHYAARFAEILGVAPDELARAGTDAFSLVRFRDEDVIRAAIEQRVEDGERLDVELELEVEGGPRWVRVRGQGVRDENGRVRRFAGAISDVTDRKRVDLRLREAQKLESVGRLAGGVAHDFNNMLAGVLGYADLIRHDSSIDDRAKRAADRIVEAAQHAAELTARLLAFSRRAPGVAVHVDVHRAIEQALALLERTIDPRIEIDLRLGAARHVVLGDAAQTQSMILNLGVNARDAMRDGGRLRVETSNVRIEADARESLGVASLTDDMLVVSVSDTGSGIPQEIKQRIFEPFFTTKPTGEGTGLGLPAVAATVRDMLGGILIDSDVGAGTTVRLYLPTAEDDERVDESDTSARAERFEGTVLVIDDQELVRDAVREMLESIGFRVVVAADGEEGVVRLRENRDDLALVVMDLLMPKWTARDTYHALRAVHPTVPILLVSGFRGEAKVEELLRAGAKGFLAKPFRRRELIQAVSAAIGRVSGDEGGRST